MEYNISKMELFQLAQLKQIVQDYCEKYANILTDYRTTSGQADFSQMDTKTKQSYEKHKRFVRLLNVIDSTLEEKILLEVKQ